MKSQFFVKWICRNKFIIIVIIIIIIIFIIIIVMYVPTSCCPKEKVNIKIQFLSPKRKPVIVGIIYRPQSQ